MADNTDKAREAFEGWHIDKLGFAAPCALHCNEHSEMVYGNAPTQHRWEGYQAATQANQEKLEEVIDIVLNDDSGDLNFVQWKLKQMIGE